MSTVNSKCRGWIATIVFALMSLPVSAAAEPEDTNHPRLLIFPEAPEADLPGDQTGRSYGVTVRRGSGFPEPVVTESEDEPERVEEIEPEPDPPQRIIRRTRRYGY